MFQKMLLTLGCAVSLFVNCGHSATIHVMKMGSGYDFELPPQKPQILSNPFIWDVTAICTILGDKEVEDFEISFKVTRKKGTLNGKKMSVGDTAQLILHPKDKIKITATPGAEMELTNFGEKTIHATCTVS